MLLGPPAGRESFTTAEKELLGSSAEVFALLIENARLSERALEQEKLRRDLALAAEVQRRLLPAQPPRCDGATLAARTVGGDYYDFFELPGDRIALAVADISGKGVAAALLMAVVQASLRVISTEGARDPSELVAKMNRFLYGSTGNNKYATFFYAQLEDGARRLRYITRAQPSVLDPAHRSGRRDDRVECWRHRARTLPRHGVRRRGDRIATRGSAGVYTDGVTKRSTCPQRSSVKTAEALLTAGRRIDGGRRVVDARTAMPSGSPGRSNTTI